MAPWEQVPSNMMQTKQQIQGYLLFVSGPKLYCLEKLKGNSFIQVCVSLLCSWRAFTTNKTKGGKKVKLYKIYKQSWQVNLFLKNCHSTSWIITKGHKAQLGLWVALLLTYVCLHSDLSSKLLDSVWVKHIFAADWTHGTASNALGLCNRGGLGCFGLQSWDCWRPSPESPVVVSSPTSLGLKLLDILWNIMAYLKMYYFFQKIVASHVK